MLHRRLHLGRTDPGTEGEQGQSALSRIDMNEWKKEKAARDEQKAAPKAPAPAPEIPLEHEEAVEIDAFRAVELRVAQILNVEEIPKSKKLYKLSIDLGYEKRTIVSGIKEFFTPEELLGKRIVVVANLEAGQALRRESNGMLLAAGDGKKTTLSLLTPDRDIPLGCRVS